MGPWLSRAGGAGLRVTVRVVVPGGGGLGKATGGECHEFWVSGQLCLRASTGPFLSSMNGCIFTVDRKWHVTERRPLRSLPDP